MMDNVIYRGDMLKAMNAAILNKDEVSFKCWKRGRNRKDPERGQSRTYDRVYVTSHSHTGTYNICDPLVSAKNMKFHHVSEALIYEFMGKKVIW